MPLVPAKCPECGGNVVVDSEKDTWICDFCKTPFVVEKAINNFNTINNVTNNVTNNNDIKADVVNVYEGKNQDFVIKAGRLVKYNGASMDVVIPEEAVIIEPYAFQHSNIHSITLNNGISVIPGEAFKDCSALQQIHLSENLQQIGESAFWNCSELKQIHLPKNLKEIGKCAFTNCRSLERIKLPDSLEAIRFSLDSNYDFGTFSGCDSLFEGCESLKEVVFPDSIDCIGKRMFFNCKSLESITANGVRNIETGAFKNCVSLEKFPEFPILTSVGAGAFQGCNSLKRIVLKAGIKWGNSVFRNCFALQEVRIDGVMNIGNGFFSGCHNIKSINVENIESITDDAFENNTCIMNELIRNNFVKYHLGYSAERWEKREIVERKVAENAKLASEIFYRRMERYIHRPLENRKICPICNMPTLNLKKRCVYKYCPIRGQDREEAIKGMAMNISRGLCPSCGAKLDMLVASISNDNQSHLTLECHNKECRLREIKGWRDYPLT